jgi:hypothetical protein
MHSIRALSTVVDRLGTVEYSTVLALKIRAQGKAAAALQGHEQNGKKRLQAKRILHYSIAVARERLDAQ